MIKWWTVEWRGTNVWGNSYSDSKVCDTEEEANALITHLKAKEGVEQIYKTSIEKIQ